ncbi:MAG: 5'/3'-nucleotidase SurE, partial [Chloroflexota bacterium]
MNILVTNDDGVTAPGLLALAQEMRNYGDVTVIAPDRNWSASGHVKTLNRPLLVKEVTLKDGSPAFASDGAPSDCVALGLLGMMDHSIDLVVSGINPHPNVGQDVTYSGTVTAAIEAAIFDIPGIAVSLNTPEAHSGPADFTSAAHFSGVIAKQVIANGLPKHSLLSVNVPSLLLEEIQGIEITRQGTRIYKDALVTHQDPQGNPYYWI